MATKPEPVSWAERHKHSMNVLSARQYTMARFLEDQQTRVIDLDVLLTLHMGTIRSFVIRGYLKQQSSTTVRWTKEGSLAVERFAAEKIERKPSLSFTPLLNLDVYDDRHSNITQIA